MQSVQSNSSSAKVVRQKAPKDSSDRFKELGDFTTTKRLLPISFAAIGIGVICAFVALVLLKLISIFTNLFFYHRFSTVMVSPASNHLGYGVILVPVIGALIIGLMARYGSDRIRGHGIPEAIEAILINGSKVDAKVALLKPLSSAVSIGSGGPFGAEGPIIMTGGAVGSLIAQILHLTSVERKTLLVAGAAAGMAATFAAPVAAVLLAVELLLFEWKPRSLIPVALASATAAVVRRYIMGIGPIFPVHAHPTFIGPAGILGCVLIGLAAGGVSSLLTLAVYGAEDAFHKLKIHWMWWPAIGGLVIGIGGLIFPKALGVGYETIEAFLQGDVSTNLIAGVMLVKSIIWAVSLGSGTSGGVLAPLLMMGCAVGAMASHILPDLGPGFWPLISMGAILGGTMRSPFTGIVFAIELTHDVNIMLPLLIACTLAYGFTVLVMRRSILTEKISRRGYHISREYSTDPMENLFVRDVMRSDTITISALSTPGVILQQMQQQSNERYQRLYPVVNREAVMQGVVTRNALDSWIQETQTGNNENPVTIPEQILIEDPIVAFEDEPLRIVVNRMAETGVTRFPVVREVSAETQNNSGSTPQSDESDSQNLYHVCGMISLYDLLKARTHNHAEENVRERFTPKEVLFR